jgi:hypothetical protein
VSEVLSTPAQLLIAIAKNGALKMFALQVLGDARNLPAIVFAIEFVGKEVKLGLQRIQIFNRPRLPRLQLHFLYFGIEGDRFYCPSALFKAMRSPISVGLIRKKEVMIEMPGIT